MYCPLLRVKGDTIINDAGAKGISWVRSGPTKTYCHLQRKEH